MNGTTRLKLTKGALSTIPVPLPPLNEQQRIVATIEEQFSRLDAAEQVLSTAVRRISALRRSILVSLIPRPLPSHWKTVRVEHAGKVQLGRQRSPKYHNGPNMKSYLRVANVFEDRLDLSDVMQMDFTRTTSSDSDFTLATFCSMRARATELVGRPAMFRGELREVCFTNSLIRFQAGPALKASSLSSCSVRISTPVGSSGRRGSQRTSRTWLPVASRQSSFPFHQWRSSACSWPQLERQLSLVDALEQDLRLAAQRGKALRRSILERAFQGKLVPQNASDEPAAPLLEAHLLRTEPSTVPQRRRRVSV